MKSNELATHVVQAATAMKSLSLQEAKKQQHLLELPQLPTMFSDTFAEDSESKEV